MSYDEPRYLAPSFVGPCQVLVTTGTFTASDHTLTGTPAVRIPIVRDAVLTGARAVVLTAGVSKVPVFVVQNSVGTALSFTISHTAGGVAGTTTLTATRTFTAGETPVVYCTHTGTASATQITPVLELTLEFREQFS